jgi:cytochrome c-type biogenesis protein CcmH
MSARLVQKLKSEGWLLLPGVLAVSVLLASPAWAQQPTADQINAVASKLSCPTCTGINVADCPTETCAQWRAKIGELLGQGYTEPQILDYFATRYGDHVLQVPPKRGFFLWVWLLPALAILSGLAILVFVVRNWSRRAAPAAMETGTLVEDEYWQRVQQEMEQAQK